MVQEEDIELKLKQVARHKRLRQSVLAALKQAEESADPTPFHIPDTDQMMDVQGTHVPQHSSLSMSMQPHV